MTVALELQPCCGKRSGIGNYTYEIARNLKPEENLKFVGNLFNFLGRNDNSQELSGISIPIREGKLFPYGVYRRIWNLVPIPYQSLFPGNADLSVFFNYIIPPRVSGKAISTVFDLTYLRFPETMEPRNRKRLRSGMEYSIGRSDHIITISEFSKREIIELLSVPEDKISVVPCAPSALNCTGGNPASIEKFGVRKPYLLYVGTIEPRKNLNRLIKAFSMLKNEQGIDHQLVLAGGKGWSNTDIYQLGASVDNVVFTGYLSEEEKYAMYQNADLFVFPSLYEGFGIPPLEAMAFGCPVVCADAASLPEVVGQAAELVDPLDEVSIAQGIWNVLADSHKSQLLVQQGYEQVKRYTWDASAKRLTEVCRAVLREP